MVDVHPTGQRGLLATACGWPWQPTIEHTPLMPVLGAPITVQYDCLPESFPALVVGLPQPWPIPLCSGGCALGVDPIATSFLTWSATYTFPNQPALVGATLAFQALPYGTPCVPGFLGLPLRTSDTMLMTF